MVKYNEKEILFASEVIQEIELILPNISIQGFTLSSLNQTYLTNEGEVEELDWFIESIVIDGVDYTIERLTNIVGEDEEYFLLEMADDSGFIKSMAYFPEVVLEESKFYTSKLFWSNEYKGWHDVESLTLDSGKKYERVNVKDGVMVLLLSPNMDKVCLVEQHRFPIGKRAISLPAGVMDKEGLTSLSTMKEEIQEECLIDPSKYNIDPVPLLTVNSLPGSLNGKVSFFRAFMKEEPKKLKYSNTIDGDVDKVHWFEVNELIDRIKKGKISQAIDPLTITGLFLLQ